MADAAPAPPPGLPRAEFIEDIAKYLEGRTADDAIRELNAAHAAYRRVEASLGAQRARLLAKKPDIDKALAAVELLRERREKGDETIDVDFGLADQVFARATVPTTGPGVALWLGAGVSVEYPLDEAAALLAANAANAAANLAAVERDLEYVKDCVTTTQVSIARVYNADVAAARKGGGGGK